MVKRYYLRFLLITFCSSMITLLIISFRQHLEMAYVKSVTDDECQAPPIPARKLYSDSSPKLWPLHEESRSNWTGLWPHDYGGSAPHSGLLAEIERYMVRVSPPVFNFTFSIPKILHQTWSTTLVPRDTRSWISKWRKTNPDYLYLFWTDKMARDFIKKYFRSLLNVYDHYELGVQKADFFRYVILFSIGGVYADIDIEPLKSLDPIRDWSSCVLSREPNEHHQVASYDKFGSNNDLLNTLACNAIMASRPGHPFLFYLISKVVHESRYVKKKRCRISDTLWCTGPWILTKTWAQYTRSLDLIKYVDPSYRVFVPESKIFLPTFDEDQIGAMKTACKNREKLSRIGARTCDRLENEDYQNTEVGNSSLTRHWWYHTYLGPPASARESCHVLDAATHAKYFFEIEYEFRASYL